MNLLLKVYEQISSTVKKIYSRLPYWIKYTITFAIVAILVFRFFLFEGHSFIHMTDGLQQEYTSLLYFRRWLLQLLSGFQTQGLSNHIQLYDFNIGYGNNIVTTVWYYLGASPITPLCVICPGYRLDVFYSIDVLFRIYLAGLSFSIYARDHGKSELATLCGSLCYCFCGYVLQKGVQHVFFIMPMFFLPLILLGIDRILAGKKSTLFIVFSVWSAVYNFYFFYMIAIGMVLYTGAQLLIDSRDPWKERLIKLFRVGIYGLISVMLAAPILIPSILAVMGNSRVGGGSYISLFYIPIYYYRFVYGCMTNTYSMYDCRTGYAVPAIAATLVLFSFIGHRKQKVAFVGLTIALSLPIVGSLFNGGGYSSNRWIFIYSLLLSYILSTVIDDLHLPDIEYKQLLIRGALVLLIYLVGYGCCILIFPENYVIYRSLVLLLMFLLGLILILSKSKCRALLQCYFFAGILISVLLNAWEYYSPVRSGVVNSYLTYGEAYRTYVDNAVLDKLLEIETEDGFLYRGKSSTASNSYLNNGTRGMDYYYSLVDNNVDKLMRDMYINNAILFRYSDFDNRFIMESLSGIRYSVNEDTYLDINDYALPMAYTYDGYIPEEKYETLSAERKQEALCYGAVVDSDSGVNSGLTETSYESDLHEISFETDGWYKADENVTTIRNEQAGNELVLTLSEFPDEDAELYVIFENVSFEDLSPKDLYENNWMQTDKWTKKIIRSAELSFEPTNSGNMQVRIGDTVRDVNYVTPDNRMYAGRVDFLCNLGCIENTNNELVICLNSIGTYSFSDIRVIVQPLVKIKDHLHDMSEKSKVEKWECGDDSVYATIKCDADSLLCITIPYSQGWRASVDGITTVTFPINRAFLGIFISEGTHEIELDYSLPGLRAGLLLLLLGIVILVIIRIGEYRYVK